LTMRVTPFQLAKILRCFVSNVLVVGGKLPQGRVAGDTAVSASTHRTETAALVNAVLKRRVGTVQNRDR
jgi:hypothetical protein